VRAGLVFFEQEMACEVSTCLDVRRVHLRSAWALGDSPSRLRSTEGTVARCQAREARSRPMSSAGARENRPAPRRCCANIPSWREIGRESCREGAQSRLCYVAVRWALLALLA